MTRTNNRKANSRAKYIKVPRRKSSRSDVVGTNRLVQSRVIATSPSSDDSVMVCLSSYHPTDKVKYMDQPIALQVNRHKFRDLSPP